MDKGMNIDRCAIIPTDTFLSTRFGVNYDEPVLVARLLVME